MKIQGSSIALHVLFRPMQLFTSHMCLVLNFYTNFFQSKPLPLTTASAHSFNTLIFINMTNPRPYLTVSKFTKAPHRINSLALMANGPTKYKENSDWWTENALKRVFIIKLWRSQRKQRRRTWRYPKMRRTRWPDWEPLMYNGGLVATGMDRIVRVCW